MFNARLAQMVGKKFDQFIAQGVYRSLADFDRFFQQMVGKAQIFKGFIAFGQDPAAAFGLNARVT